MPRRPSVPPNPIDDNWEGRPLSVVMAALVGSDGTVSPGAVESFLSYLDERAHLGDDEAEWLMAEIRSAPDTSAVARALGGGAPGSRWRLLQDDHLSDAAYWGRLTDPAFHGLTDEAQRAYLSGVLDRLSALSGADYRQSAGEVRAGTSALQSAIGLRTRQGRAHSPHLASRVSALLVTFAAWDESLSGEHYAHLLETFASLPLVYEDWDVMRVWNAAYQDARPGQVMGLRAVVERPELTHQMLAQIQHRNDSSESARMALYGSPLLASRSWFRRRVLKAGGTDWKMVYDALPSAELAGGVRDFVDFDFAAARRWIALHGVRRGDWSPEAYAACFTHPDAEVRLWALSQVATPERTPPRRRR